jgi:hypothetical protein
VAQGIGFEFKPQYCKKKKKNNPDWVGKKLLSVCHHSSQKGKEAKSKYEVSRFSISGAVAGQWWP